MTTRVRSDEAPDTIVPRLLSIRAKKPKGRPVIVAVAGGSGDGKGHLIGRLIERLNASDGVPRDGVAVLALDNYYIGVERMKAEGVSTRSPQFAFVRDGAGALVLRGYTLESNGAVEVYWFEPPRRKRALSADSLLAKAPESGTVWLAAATIP